MATSTPVSIALKVAFCLLGLLGIYGTWGRSNLNGSLAHVSKLLLIDKTVPGTNQPFQTFTGIAPVDSQLQVFVGFFWQAVDGSHPTTSAFSLYFATQFLGIVSFLYINSYRSGSRRRWICNATVWLSIFQATAIATSGPWWALLLLLLPSDQGALPGSSDATSFAPTVVLPLSLLLTFVIPTILMGVRSAHQQLAMVVWNVFPFMTGLSQTLLSNIFSALTSSRHGLTITPTRSRLASRIAFASTMAPTFAAHAFFSGFVLSTSLFPMLFASAPVDYASALAPSSIFHLPVALPPTPVTTSGQGTLEFLQWDLFVATLTMAVLAASVLGRAFRSSLSDAGYRLELAWTVGFLVASLAAGPGTVTLAAFWLVDEIRDRGDKMNKSSFSSNADTVKAKVK